MYSEEKITLYIEKIFMCHFVKVTVSYLPWGLKASRFHERFSRYKLQESKYDKR